MPARRQADASPIALFALVGLIVLALAAVLFASFVTGRSNASERERLTDEIEPATLSLDRLSEAVITLAADARGYAISGSPGSAARYQADLVELEAAEAELSKRAAVVGRAAEASTLTLLAQDYEAIARAIVDARNRGDLGEAARLSSEEGPTRLDTFDRESGALKLALGEQRDAALQDIADSERRESATLAIAVGVCMLAAAALVWFAIQSRRLSLAVATEQRRLASVIADVPGVVWEAWGQPDAANQRIDFVSDHVTEMLGYSVDEWLQTPNFWLSIVHPDDKERAAREATATFERGGTGTNQFRWVAKDGRVLDVLAYSSAIKDAEGRPLGMRGVTIDISERVRAEEGLRFTATASGALFRSLDFHTTLATVAQMAVPGLADWCTIHLLDDGGKPQLFVVSHKDPEMVTWARELQERFPPDENAPTGVPHVVRTGISELVPVMPPELLETPNLDEDQREIIRRLRLTGYICVPMVARGRVIGAVTLVSAESGRIYDERDLALAEDLALRAAAAVDHARLYEDAILARASTESVIASVSNGLIQTDANDRLVAMNPAAQQMLGYVPEDFAGRRVHEVMHHARPDGSPYPAAECPLLGVVRSGSAATVTDAFVRKDGSFVEVEAATAPIVVDGAVTGTVSVFQDITDRLRRERMKDDFLAFASHELRSPLTTVNGFAKWLVRRVTQSPELFDDDMRDAVETLSEGADRMASTIELFLDLTRIDSDRLELDVSEADLCEIVRTEAEHLQVREPEASVTVSVPAQSVPAMIDGHRVRQVVTNLLDNAVKYGGDPPRVEVTLGEDGGMALITVRDNGAGIPAADQPFVFERFYQGRAERGGKGLGIGLFVARQVVNRLGGSLSFTSHAGAGTEFRLSLPLAGPAPAPEQTDAATPGG